MKNLYRCLMIAASVALVGLPAWAVVPSEHCSGACSSTATANAQQCWDIIVHDSHEINGTTGNCGEDSTAPGGVTCGSGSGSRTFYNGTVWSFGCASGSCTTVGAVKCPRANGTVGTYNVDRECRSASGFPAVVMGPDGANCYGDENWGCGCSGFGFLCWSTQQ